MMLVSLMKHKSVMVAGVKKKEQDSEHGADPKPSSTSIPPLKYVFTLALKLSYRRLWPARDPAFKFIFIFHSRSV